MSPTQIKVMFRRGEPPLNQRLFIYRRSRRDKKRKTDSPLLLSTLHRRCVLFMHPRVRVYMQSHAGRAEKLIGSVV